MAERPLPGVLFDRYQVMGTDLNPSPWYRQTLAQDTQRRETVVVKILQLQSNPPDRLGEFREWYGHHLLHVPGILPVRAMHLQGQELYVIERPPEGSPWRNMVGQRPHPASLIPKADALLERFSQLHARGILHNCILPENCWWHPQEGWTIADAGWLRWCFLNGYAPAGAAHPEAWTAMTDANQLSALFAYTLLNLPITNADLPLRATAELKRRARQLPHPWPTCLLTLWGPAVTEEWSPLQMARQTLEAPESARTAPGRSPAGTDPGNTPPAPLPITGSIASAAAISAGGLERGSWTPEARYEPASGIAERVSLTPDATALDPPSRRRESTLLARTIFLTLLITLALVGGAFYGVGAFLFKATVTPVPVPDVVGMTIEAAKKAVEPEGFTVQLNQAEYSDAPQGKIIRQSPGAKTTVKEFREIYVTISRGARTIKLPSLIGLTEEAAVESLGQLNLKVGKASYQYTRDATAGKVIEQDPPPNQMLAKEEPVHLVISRGVLKGETAMPDTTGQPLSRALARLTTAKLRVRKIVRRYDYEATTTTVALQSPSAGALVDEGTEVYLTVTAPKSQEPLGDFQIRISTQLPPFEGSQSVKVIVRDGRGESIPYEKDHAGGDRIELLVDAFQTTRVAIYLDGKLIREEQY